LDVFTPPPMTISILPWAWPTSWPTRQGRLYQFPTDVQSQATGFIQGAEDDPVGACGRCCFYLAVNRHDLFGGVKEIPLARADHNQQSGAIVECQPRGAYLIHRGGQAVEVHGAA
jgi:hypothetical protein